jgi:hypothetical protein
LSGIVRCELLPIDGVDGCFVSVGVWRRRPCVQKTPAASASGDKPFLRDGDAALQFGHLVRKCVELAFDIGAVRGLGLAFMMLLPRMMASPVRASPGD